MFIRLEVEVHLLYRHEANAGEITHDEEELPELDIAQQIKSTNIYAMRSI